MDAGDAGGVTVALLGPVRAWRDGRSLDLGPPLRQAVLTVLSINANRTVTRDEIIDAVWGEAPPASAINGVQVHVAGLRRVLEPDWTRGTPGRVLASGARGYTLHLDHDRLDLDVFSARLRRARQLAAAHDQAAAGGAFDDALRLWHGTALAGVPGRFADTQRLRLEELRLGATEDRAQTMIALGNCGELVAELTALAAEHPLREQVQMLLMMALQRTGRQAEALAIYTCTKKPTKTSRTI